MRRPPLVVGIGASAGGLEAFTRFFAAMPANSGMAFVLVQHLDPQRVSMLVELLSAKTSMPVIAATDGIPVVANSVFVIPPNSVLTIVDGILRLS
jgi:two-component system, chemotaxis family, CheB/CheR fusion protein